ncbi:MAG: DUF4402 domain-containing protein [Marinomonas sp.]
MTSFPLPNSGKTLSSAFGRAAIVTAVASALLAGPVQAQSAAIPSSTQVRGDTRITKIADLDFGTIIPGDTGGTIVIDPDATVTTTGSVVSMGGTAPAEFSLTRQIFVDYPTYSGPAGTDSIQLVHTSNPALSMTLRDFTTDFDRTGLFGLPAYFFSLTHDFRVAGTLDVGANQPGGVYTGTFLVTVDYN